MKQEQVIILENNESFAQQLQAELSKWEGLSVCAVTDDGEEGLSLIERHKPSLILLSLHLKRKDGFSVLEELHKLGKRVNVVVLGNFSDDAVINRVISLGARYYMMKPVSAEVVAGRLKQLAEEDAGAPVTENVERKRAGSLDERISGIFISIGIPPHIKGYNYLREGIKMAVEDPHIINNVTKKLYPMIGERFETSASKVERAIRHAIEVAWNRGRIDAVNAIFGARVYIGTEKPTNSEFIALVADKLILENMA